MKVTTLLLVVAMVIQQVSSAASYQKVVLDNPEALCLDGTPGVYYVHQGPLRNKWILSFEGGGWCGSSMGLNQSLEDCLTRSTGYYGSSSKYKDVWQQSQGIFSDDPINYYRDWSKIQLKYCTGTGHQGYKKDPVPYKGTNLYFKGQNVTIAFLDSLQALYDIFSNSTTDIIITGQSAGGLAAFSWANYIKDRAAPSTRVISLPDSGIFLDSTSVATGRNQYRLLIQNFMKIVNEEVDPPSAECNAAYPTQLWKCMFAEYLHSFIKVPIFAIQSLYDTWCIPNILGIRCETGGSLSGCNQQQMSSIEQYRLNTSKVLKTITAKSAKNGYWAPSCCNHLYTIWNKFYDISYRIPSGSANSLMQGIVEWDEGQQVTYEHMDQGSWPTNRPCSGLGNTVSHQSAFLRLRKWNDIKDLASHQRVEFDSAQLAASF